jgi:hypothetical protein
MKRFTIHAARCVLLLATILFALVGSTRAQNTFPNPGYVGIGTTNPSTPLEVRGTAGWNADGNITTLGTSEACRGLRITNRYNGNSLGVSAVQSLAAATTCGVLDTPWPLALNPDGGNVGIGTPSPTNKLEIVDSGNAIATVTAANGTSMPNAKYHVQLNGLTNTPWGEMQIFAPNGAGSEYLRWNVGNSSGSVYADILTISRTGNVGIGTGTPAAKLDVNGSIRGGGYSAGAGNISSYSMEVGGPNPTATNGEATIFFHHHGVVANQLRYTNGTLYWEAAGNGYGTTQPNLVVSGTINAKYQDVAEWVPSSEQLAAGTVVVLDSTKSNQVTSSSTAYDTRVAGVISAQPGITLGEKSDEKVLVATTGRVRVRVDASKSPINIGDLLVTSDISGVAMKSEPVDLGGRKMHTPGTLIGKALEPLQKGSGTILVLLSLQ